MLGFEEGGREGKEKGRGLSCEGGGGGGGVFFFFFFFWKSRADESQSQGVVRGRKIVKGAGKRK